MSRRPSAPSASADPFAERLLEIGRLLRESRQQRGEDLYDVADYLRIKPSYLFAIEEGNLAALPERVYALGFLRTYADHLGYDGPEVVRSLKMAVQPGAAPQLELPQPVAENRLPSVGVVLLALGLAGLVYGGWHVVQSGGGPVLARIAAIPGEIGQYAATYFDAPAEEGLTAGLAAEAAGQPAPPVAAPAALAPVTSTTRASIPATAAVPATLAAPAATPSAGSAPEQAGAVMRAPAPVSNALTSLTLDAEAEHAALAQRGAEATAGELLAGLRAHSSAATPALVLDTVGALAGEAGRVVLVAREASWVQVQSSARDYVRSRTLEPGDRFTIPDRGDLALWTGNAGGLEIWIDGRQIGVLGRSGSVLRDVPLAPDALLNRLN